MRDALSLSDQAIAHGSGKLESDDVRQMLGTVSRTKVLDLLDALIADDARQALTVLDAIASHSPDYSGTLDELASVLHQIALAQAVPGSIDTILENETLTEVLFPNMIKSAAKYAEELGSHEIFHGLKKMEGQLNHEIERLEFLHEKNSNIRREEIELAIDEKNTLASLIQSASVRMDAVQLIQKG